MCHQDSRKTAGVDFVMYWLFLVVSWIFRLSARFTRARLNYLYGNAVDDDPEEEEGEDDEIKLETPLIRPSDPSGGPSGFRPIHIDSEELSSRDEGILWHGTNTLRCLRYFRAIHLVEISEGIIKGLDPLTEHFLEDAHVRVWTRTGRSESQRGWLALLRFVRGGEHHFLGPGSIFIAGHSSTALLMRLLQSAMVGTPYRIEGIRTSFLKPVTCEKTVCMLLNVDYKNLSATGLIVDPEDRDDVKCRLNARLERGMDEDFHVGFSLESPENRRVEFPQDEEEIRGMLFPDPVREVFRVVDWDDRNDFAFLRKESCPFKAVCLRSKSALRCLVGFEERMDSGIGVWSSLSLLIQSMMPIFLAEDGPVVMDITWEYLTKLSRVSANGLFAITSSRKRKSQRVTGTSVRTNYNITAQVSLVGQAVLARATENILTIHPSG